MSVAAFVAGDPPYWQQPYGSWTWPQSYGSGQTPHLCPMCQGWKQVQPPPQSTIGSAAPEKIACPVCQGQGVLWR